MARPSYSDKEIKLTAALYANKTSVVRHLKATGRLPEEIDMGGAHIGLRLLIERRGTDITLTPDEKLVYDAIIKERRLPGGGAILVGETKKKPAARRKPRGSPKKRKR